MRVTVFKTLFAAFTTTAGAYLGFFKGGGVTLCHAQGTYQIGMSTSTPCYTKSDFFLDEQWAWGEGQAYKIAT